MTSEKEWLKQKFYPGLDAERLISIFYFTLIWNLFEKRCCDCDARIDKHPQEIAETEIDELVLNEVWEHFQARYWKNGDSTQFFKDFKFNKNGKEPNDHKDFVKEILSNIDASNIGKRKALLLIAFRLRNNLFHGEKEVDKLYDQNENFRQINRLLMEILNIYKTSAKKPVGLKLDPARKNLHK